MNIKKEKKINITKTKEAKIRKGYIFKNGKNYGGKIINNNKENRGIKIIFWIIMALFLLITILINKIKIIKIQKRKVLNTKNKKKKYIINDFNEVLPKISLENKSESSFEEIFNSRTLILSGANLSAEYLRYIRPINEKEEQKFKKNILHMKQRFPLKLLRKEKINIILRILPNYALKKN